MGLHGARIENILAEFLLRKGVSRTGRRELLQISDLQTLAGHGEHQADADSLGVDRNTM